MPFVLDRLSNQLPDPEGDHPRHDEEQDYMQQELIRDAVVYHERHQHTDDYGRVATLNFGRLVECIDLVEQRANSQVH